MRSRLEAVAYSVKKRRKDLPCSSTERWPRLSVRRETSGDFVDILAAIGDEMNVMTNLTRSCQKDEIFWVERDGVQEGKKGRGSSTWVHEIGRDDRKQTLKCRVLGRLSQIRFELGAYHVKVNQHKVIWITTLRPDTKLQQYCDSTTA